MGEYKEIGSFIDRTYKVVRQDLINRFKELRVEITPEQWVILSKLSGGEGMYQTDLANESFRDKPTVSRIIDLLVKKKLVSRRPDASDGRKYLISLTEKGRETVQIAQPAVDASRAQGWHNLSQKEYDAMVNTLDKIFSNYSNRK